MSESLKIAVGATTVLSIGIALAVVRLHPFASQSAPLLDWTDQTVVARGEALYQEQCLSCHGPVGGAESALSTASAPSHSADGHTWEHPDFALVKLTKSGEVAELCRDVTESSMPEFAQDLSDRQIVDVLSYIKSTWPEDIRTRHDEINLLYQSQNDAVRDLLDLPES